MKKIIIASDHRGINLKDFIISKLNSEDYIIENIEHNNNYDYTYYAKEVANKIKEDSEFIGILICGTGFGVNITANRHKGIRAVNCCNTTHSYMARLHNDANVICLGAGHVLNSEAMEIIYKFMSTDFEGGRHIERIKNIEI